MCVLHDCLGNGSQWADCRPGQDLTQLALLGIGGREPFHVRRKIRRRVASAGRLPEIACADRRAAGPSTSKRSVRRPRPDHASGQRRPARRSEKAALVARPPRSGHALGQPNARLCKRAFAVMVDEGTYDALVAFDEAIRRIT